MWMEFNIRNFFPSFSVFYLNQIKYTLRLKYMDLERGGRWHMKIYLSLLCEFFFSFLCNLILIQQVGLWSFSELLLIRDDKVEMDHKKRMGWEKRTLSKYFVFCYFCMEMGESQRTNKRKSAHLKWGAYERHFFKKNFMVFFSRIVLFKYFYFF